MTMGLLQGLTEIQQIMQSDGCSWEIAQQRWHEALEEQAREASKVVYVDFRKRDA
jgi:hypothetical protein